MTQPQPAIYERVERGSFWRRKQDGKLFEVVHVGPPRGGEPARVQLKPAEAKNLKNTRWIDVDRLPDRYEPGGAPPPPNLAERVMAEIGVPNGATATVKMYIDFPHHGDYARNLWGAEAVEFVRRYAPNVTWKWMNVPSNAQRNKQDGWWSLDLYATADGVKLHLDGPGGWTTEQGQALTDEMKAAKADATPPPVEPDHRCPRCALGWSDDDS
jgi:hypothetical protein